MLDTKWPEIRTRNKDEFTLKKGKQVKIAYAEFFKEGKDTLFVDYLNLEHITVGTIMSIDNDAVSIEITENKGNELIGKVKNGWEILINRPIEFENYIPKLAFLSERDKKHIQRWVQHKAHLIAVSYIRNKENVDMIKSYLKDIQGEHLKIIAKIETKDAIDQIEDIVFNTDGIILNRVKLNLLVGEKKAKKVKHDIISICHKFGKPVIITTDLNIRSKDNTQTISLLKEEMEHGVDTFMLTKETAVSDDPIDSVTMLYDLINENAHKTTTNYTLDELNHIPERVISDYIIFNAYRASREIPIKAIICPTESGYTPARLSSLKPGVPIISFTKNDGAYRYINLLRWVKGYKISSTFDYTNIKQIWKEIIRILFKGNISLDDKILIVHSSLEQNKSNMINGIEVYKFKDI